MVFTLLYSLLYIFTTGLKAKKLHPEEVGKGSFIFFPFFLSVFLSFYYRTTGA
jgi:hypothetical protein